MQINIHDFIEQAKLAEPFYPGKKLVKLCPQPGEYKSHCVVYDWTNSSVIRIEIKAGLSGRDLPHQDLTRYPVSFQAPTFFEIDVATSTLRPLAHSADEAEAEDDDDTESGRSGKSGSGGKRPARKALSASLLSFAAAVEGAIPETGTITQMVVMGLRIAEEAYASVLHKFYGQVAHAKIAASDLAAAAGKLVTKFTPPAFLKPKGDENAVYKYNREKNEVMFSGMIPS